MNYIRNRQYQKGVMPHRGGRLSESERARESERERERRG